MRTDGEEGAFNISSLQLVVPNHSQLVTPHSAPTSATLTNGNTKHTPGYYGG